MIEKKLLYFKDRAIRESEHKCETLVEKKTKTDEIEEIFKELSSESLEDKVKLFSKEEAEKILFEAEAYYREAEFLHEELEELILNFKERVLEKRLLKTKDSLMQAEALQDEKHANEILELYKNLGKEKEKINFIRREKAKIK